MLVELGLVEQRYQAVLEVLNGATVTDVARRHVVGRQTAHQWLRRYAAHGLAALADGSSRPRVRPPRAPGVGQERLGRAPTVVPGLRLPLRAVSEGPVERYRPEGEL